jgi:hypothetical protein
VKQFPEVAVRLKGAWSAASLNAFFCFQNESLQQRRQQQNAQNLEDLKENIRKDHGSLLP